jgi:glyoxylase-like metal-dependent hydrolase (beta-lactamase superfamily II)
MEIIRSVYLMAGPHYGTHENVYVIKGENSLVMVDTGIDEEELAVVDGNIAYWGLKDYPISHVLITHSHYDHCANAHILRKRGAKIVAGPSDAEGIELGDDRTASYAFTHKKKFVPCPVDLKVKDGDVINVAGLKIEAIHVPGYTKGSMFYKLVTEGKNVLFTGDVVKVDVGNTEKVESLFWVRAKLGWSGGVDYDQEQYLETLEKISTMNADILLPGHLGLCLNGGWQVLRAAYTAARWRWLMPWIYPTCTLDKSKTSR